MTITWGQCEELKIWQLAMIMIGYSPYESVVPPQEDDPGCFVTPHDFKLPSSYMIAKTILWGGFVREEIEGRRGPEIIPDENFDPIFLSTTEQQYVATLNVSSVRAYLDRQGITCKLLDVGNGPNYLDPENNSYSPMLAAAVSAWLAISSDPSLTKGKSIKQALINWITEHNNHYDLSDTAIKQAAKTANWETEGGSPATPSCET